MVHQLDTYSNVEVSGEVSFPRAKRFASTEIHLEILTTYNVEYGPRKIPRIAIVKWCQQLEDGHTDLTDAKVQHGQPRARRKT